MKNNTFYVYQYIDPRPETFGSVFYIGKGKGNRCLDHKKRCFNPLLERVIDRIRAAGLEPIVEIVSQFDNEDDAFAAEKDLVAQHGRRDLGTGTLCNLTPGGEGSAGYRYTDEQRKKLSEIIKTRYSEGWTPHPDMSLWAKSVNLGRIRSPEHIAKMVKAKTGKTYSAEIRKRMGDAKKGRIVSEETRAKISAARKGHPVSEETRKKIGDANRGNIWTDEMRARQSEILKARPPRGKLGRPLPPRSEAHRAALSAAMKGKPNGREGKPVPQETKDKISAAHKGKVFSPEHRAAISEGHRRRRERKKEGMT